MAMTCTRMSEWIAEHWSAPVEEWEDRRRQECKKRRWYDPRSWICWLIHYVVKVVRWIVITTLKLVVTIVCRMIDRWISMFVDLLRALYLFAKSLVTWNKCTLQEGLAALGD